MDIPSLTSINNSEIRPRQGEVCSHLQHLIYRRFEDGYSVNEIALWFEIHISTVYRIVDRLLKSNGSYKRKRDRMKEDAAKIDTLRREIHRTATLSNSDHMYLTPCAKKGALGRDPVIPDSTSIGMAIRYIMTKYPHLYLDEIKEFLQKCFGEDFSISSISRYLRSRGFRTAVGQRIVKLANTEDRRVFISSIPKIVKSVSQLIFIDETSHGKWTGFRRYGRSPQGTAVKMDFLPKVHPSCCLMAMMTTKGVESYSVLLDPPKKYTFEHFLKKIVLPKTTSNSIIVLDNARIHDFDNISEILDPMGVKFLFLPAYSPDLNPIEIWFSTYKQYWKRHCKTPLTLDNVVIAVDHINKSSDWSKTISSVYKQSLDGVKCVALP